MQEARGLQDVMENQGTGDTATGTGAGWSSCRWEGGEEGVAALLWFAHGVAALLWSSTLPTEGQAGPLGAVVVWSSSP